MAWSTLAKSVYITVSYSIEKIITCKIEFLKESSISQKTTNDWVLEQPMFLFHTTNVYIWRNKYRVKKEKREWINVSYWWLVVTRKLKEWVRHWVYRFSRIWCVIEKRTCSRSKDNKNSWGFIATICLHLSIITLNMSL